MNKEPLSYDELVAMLLEAYEALYSESVSCPWCGGEIGWSRQTHFVDCPILKVPGIINEIRTLNKARRIHEQEMADGTYWKQLDDAITVLKDRGRKKEMDHINVMLQTGLLRRKGYRIVCFNCHEQNWIFEPIEKVAATLAENDGWREIDSKWYCPKCYVEIR